MKLQNQPEIKVGIIEGEQKIKFFVPSTAVVEIVNNDNIVSKKEIFTGDYEIQTEDKNIVMLNTKLQKIVLANLNEYIKLKLKNPAELVKIYNIKIGRKFHWERYQNHEFYGEIVVKYTTNGFVVINKLPVETYLLSVISSEMSSTANIEYLKAHAVISRSWVVRRILGEEPISDFSQINDKKILKWYGQKGHTEFDVCNDDHCQRYHGFSKISSLAKHAVEETTAEVLMYNNKICNTVFYKACGGITEYYSTAWEDKNFEYLRPVWDAVEMSDKPLPDFTKEKNVREFIDSYPDVFCNTTTETIQEFLTDFDKETTNFFRWEVRYKKRYLQELIYCKTAKDIGEIVSIIPLKRGASGRIYELQINGSNGQLLVGKELEIRKILSESHLYSSCFYVDFDGDDVVFKGAGWGHGVGLCQIGAAVMSKKGFGYREILQHYYPSSYIEKIY